MANPWFRFYAETLRDPKVLKLSDKDYRLWTKLLCIACENEGEIPPLDDLKMVLSVRLDHLKGGVDRLIKGGLIDPLADGYAPHGWQKRQYKSDSSTERVRKHREKRNVSETPPDTETDSEQKASSVPREPVRAKPTDDMHPHVKELYEIIQPVAPIPDPHIVVAWERDGIDFPYVAKAVVRELVEREARKTSVPIGRFKYFDAAVREEWAKECSYGRRANG